MANYLGYAQMMGQRNPLAQGLSDLGTTLDQQYDRRRQAGVDKRQNSLADLQMRREQMQLDEEQARRDATIKATGATDITDAYSKKMQNETAAKSSAAIIQEAMTIDKIAGPEAALSFYNGKTGKNLEYSGKKGEWTTTIDKDTGAIYAFNSRLYDPAKPSASFQLLKEGTPKEVNQTVEQLTSKALKGDKHSQDVLNAMQQRELAKAKANRELITTGGGRGSGGGGISYEKAPSGYRYTEDGNLEAIPGGPAALKVDAVLQGKEKAKGAYESSIAVVDKLLMHPGRGTGTGLSSKLDPRNYIPGTDAYDFQRELESFDSVLFLSNIEKMKGMGALSNAEGAKVSAAAGAIKPGMKDTTFVNNLRIIRAELAKAKQRIENGNLIGASGNQAPSGNSKGKDPLGIL